MEQTQAPPAPKLNVQACIANPDRDCIAEIVLDLARRDTNDSNRETIAERLAIGGRIDLAERLAEYVRNPANRRHLQRVLAQRRIVEDAVARPDTSADLTLFDAFAQGNGPLANGDPVSENSPFIEVATDIIGDLPYGPFFVALPDPKSRFTQPRFGNATLRALRPRWQAFAERLPAARRSYELQVLAMVLRSMGDLDGAAATLRDAQRLATGTANGVVARGWLRLGQTENALHVAQNLPAADPDLTLLLADALLNQNAPPDEVMPLIRAALPVVYQAGPNTNFANLRQLIRITAKAGYPDKAKGTIQDGAASSSANFSGSGHGRGGRAILPAGRYDRVRSDASGYAG
jgi:hypothetical protein